MMEPPGIIVRPTDGIQTLTGCPTGRQDMEGNYDGGEYLGPPGIRTNKVSSGHNPEIVPAVQVAYATYQYGGSGNHLSHKRETLQAAPPRGRSNNDLIPSSGDTR